MAQSDVAGVLVLQDGDRGVYSFSCLDLCLVPKQCGRFSNNTAPVLSLCFLVGSQFLEGCSTLCSSFSSHLGCLATTADEPQGQGRGAHMKC